MRCSGPERALALAALSLVLVTSGCGSASRARTGVSAATCASVPAGHRAYVVATDGTGSTHTACVDVSAPRVSAQAVLADSGLDVRMARLSFGVAVCSVEGEPAQASGCIPSGASACIASPRPARHSHPRRHPRAEEQP